MIDTCTPCPLNNRLERAGSTPAALSERSAEKPASVTVRAIRIESEDNTAASTKHLRGCLKWAQ